MMQYFYSTGKSQFNYQMQKGNSQRTGDTLVALLIARVTNSKAGMPTRRRSRSWLTRATIAANATVLALPTHFGHVR